ncbi:hypothetical protein ACH5RR_005201 [Cinchona calisaya]|uniref:HMA domain-containing protein n=1 Tax=Cinchona calisaya TaxID=153742 RepID=A0ABD3AKI0_9GENT
MATLRDYAFMTCSIKVNTRSPGWQRTVSRVLSKIHGVGTCKMDEYGVIQVSGIVSPEILIKNLSKAGRKAELLWLQYGQCCSNLYAGPMPSRSSSAHDHSNTYYDFHGYDAYGYYQPGHSYRPFAGLAHELQQQQQSRANFGGPPRHTVYVPRYDYRGDTPGCCSLM